MLAVLETAARRSLRVSLRLLERAGASGVLLFFVCMQVKLLLFNVMLDVQNMGTTPDDLLVDLGALAVLASWTFWLPVRGRAVALAALNLLLTLVLYADLVYYRYFQDLLSVPVLLQAGQVDSLGGSIRTLLNPLDLLFAADWLIVFPAAIRAAMRRRDSDKPTAAPRLRTLTLRFSLGLLVLAAGMTLAFVPVSIAKKTWAGALFPNAWWNVSLYNVTGLFGYHGYDAYKYAKASMSGAEMSLPHDEVREAERWFEDRERERRELERDPLFGAYRGRNVVLVQAEAFQSFVIGRRIAGKEITPHLNRLIEGSLYYERFYHQTSSGRTADADFAAQCSLHPARSGAVFVRFASHTFDCTPAALKAQGYSAAAYHAYDGGFWNRNAMYKTLGYDSFYSKKAFELDEPLGWSLGDKSFLRQSAQLIAKEKQPFYAFLITLSSHHPYTLPAKERKLDVGELSGTMLGDYLQAVHYVDAAVGGFIAELERLGLWDDTVFLFYGDHDNSIQEWANVESLLGRKLSEPDRQLMRMQVPLIVRLPDERLAGTRSEPGGQLDLSPTILHLLGIRSEGPARAGLPLVTERPLEGRSVVFRSGAYTDGKVYYLPSESGDAASGACYRISPDGSGTAGGELAPEACRAGAEEARKQLAMSDRVVEYDLIPSLRGNGMN